MAQASRPAAQIPRREPLSRFGSFLSPTSPTFRSADSLEPISALYVRVQVLAAGGRTHQSLFNAGWHLVVAIHRTAIELDLEYSAVGIVTYCCDG